MASPTEFINDALLEENLVDIWPDYGCLYDVRSKDFKNREKRDAAITEIAEKLNQTGDWVRTKLKNLRNSYTKAKKPASSGSARKTMTKRTTWLLERLQFLAPHIAVRTSVSSLDSQEELIGDPDDDNQDDDGDTSFIQDDAESPTTPTGNSKSTKEPLKTKMQNSRKRQADDEYLLIKGLTQSIAERKNKKQNRDNLDGAIAVFGRYISETLAELDPRMRNIAKHRINDILFEAQMGTLSHHEPQRQYSQSLNYTFPTQTPWQSHNMHHQNSWLTQSPQHTEFTNMMPPQTSWVAPNQQPNSSELSENM